MQRRIALGWLLLGLILAPAVAIVVWLTVVKGPPRNAVLIEVAPPAGGVAGESASPTEPPMPAGAKAGSLAPTKSVMRSATPLALKPSTQGFTSTTAPASTSPTPAEEITVYVSGAVNKPGVYTLTVGSRVADAVQMAGGVSAEADLEGVNLAARIADADHIIIPRKGATPIVASATPPRQTQLPTRTPLIKPGGERQATSQPRSAMQQRVNINSASASELEAIPGVGPVLAGRIIAYREANGSFKSVEELVGVAGIKDALFAKLRDYVTVGP